MSETIKASEITPGMVIEWTDRDAFTRMLVKRYNPSRSTVRSVGGAFRYLAPDTDVEVLAAPPVMPPEPEALGARVKAGDKLFLRAYDDDCAWLEVTGNIHGVAYTWEEVNEFGPVTVIDGNPSWEVESSEDAPEQWDDIEEALKHCDRVIDMDGDPWFYLGGDLHVTLSGTAIRWSHSTEAANNYGPFRRS